MTDEKFNLQKLAHLFLSDDLSDITIIVGQEPHCRYFPAYRFILGIASPVFKAQFFGPLASERKEITLNDEDPVAFEEVEIHLH